MSLWLGRYGMDGEKPFPKSRISFLNLQMWKPMCQTTSHPFSNSVVPMFHTPSLPEDWSFIESSKDDRNTKFRTPFTGFLESLIPPFPLGQHQSWRYLLVRSKSRVMTYVRDKTTGELIVKLWEVFHQLPSQPCRNPLCLLGGFVCLEVQQSHHI